MAGVLECGCKMSECTSKISVGKGGGRGVECVAEIETDSLLLRLFVNIVQSFVTIIHIHTASIGN